VLQLLAEPLVVWHRQHLPASSQAGVQGSRGQHRGGSAWCGM
jgi:hypothetical protein